MKRSIAVFMCSCSVVFLLGTPVSKARTYHVSPAGADRNEGTLNEPLKTIETAASRMQAGDTCLIHEGTYHEGVLVNSLEGRSSAPLVFSAYQNDQVILDGTVSIEQIRTKDWIRHRGNIYKTTLAEDIWQLFDDGRMVVAARWPNARLDDESIWNQDATWAHAAHDTSFGRWVVNENSGYPDLAATGLDFTGAMAVLNIGIWQTHSRRVTHHEAGSNTFTYDADNPRVGHPEFWKPWQKEQHRAYLECHLNGLDTPNEWYYNPATKELYYWAPDGRMPSGNVRGKTMEYAFEIRNSSHVTLKGFRFFGSTFSVVNSTSCTIEDCNLEYYEYSRRMLGVEDAGLHNAYTCSTRMTGSGHTLRNCTFAYCDGGAFTMEGKNHRFENVLGHDLDWSGVGYHTFHFQKTKHAVIRRLTAYRTGASECINGGETGLIELCDMGEGLGVMQRPDGATIQLRPQGMNGTVVRYNWSHDHIKFGLRLDGDYWDLNKGYGVNGTFHHNAVWGLKPPGSEPAIKVKGDYNKICNNVSYDNTSIDIEIQGSGNEKDGNTRTMVKNNASGELAGDRKKVDQAVPGTDLNNWVGNVWEEVMDAANRDFRPKPDSAFIDKGAFIPGMTEDYSGRAPDVGPYEYGDENYWIPGFQTAQASRPIPADGAENAKADASLIWLGGYQGAAYEIYIGLRHEAVATADPSSPLFRGRRQNNIYTPNGIPLGKTCYWRIDTVKENGEIVRGTVWQFKRGK